MYTAVSTKVVQTKRKSVRNNTERYSGKNPIYWVFLRLPFGILAYAFTLFWTTFVETAVYSMSHTEAFECTGPHKEEIQFYDFLSLLDLSLWRCTCQTSLSVRTHHLFSTAISQKSLKTVHISSKFINTNY